MEQQGRDATGSRGEEPHRYSGNDESSNSSQGGPFPTVYAEEETLIEKQGPDGVTHRKKTTTWTHQENTGKVTWKTKTEKERPEGGPPEVIIESEDTDLLLGD